MLYFIIWVCPNPESSGKGPGYPLQSFVPFGCAQGDNKTISTAILHANPKALKSQFFIQFGCAFFLLLVLVTIKSDGNARFWCFKISMTDL